MPVKLLTSGGGGVNLVPSSSIASDQTMYLPTSGTSGGTVLCTDSTGGTANGVLYLNGSKQVTSGSGLVFDSSGNLLVGTTSAGSQGQRFATDKSGGGNYFAFGSNTSNAFVVYNSSTTGVYLVSGLTSWSANSDERLKDIIEPITNAAEKVSSLRAVIGKYKTDEEGTRRSFLIAQDVQAVLPEAVNVQNDEQGTLGLQYTDVIPLLVAAIKELKMTNDSQAHTIESLTQRIEALEYTK